MKPVHPTTKMFLHIAGSLFGFLIFMGAWTWFGYFSSNVELNELWVTKPVLIIGPVAVLGAVMASLYFNIFAFISCTIIAMASFLTIFHYDVHWETALKKQELYGYQKQELARAKSEADHFFYCGENGYIALTDGNTYFSPQLHNFKDKRYYIEYFPKIGDRKGRVYHLGLYPGGFENKTLAQFIKKPMKRCTKGGKTPYQYLNQLKPLNSANF